MQSATAQKIVNAYGAVLGEKAATGLIRDLASLPCSKDEIKGALKFAFDATPDAAMRQHLRNAYIALADFQELSDLQVRALQNWNQALVQSTRANVPDAAKLAETMANAGEEVLVLQQRVSAEADVLVRELTVAGM